MHDFIREFYFLFSLWISLHSGLYQYKIITSSLHNNSINMEYLILLQNLEAFLSLGFSWELFHTPAGDTVKLSPDIFQRKVVTTYSEGQCIGHPPSRNRTVI